MSGSVVDRALSVLGGLVCLLLGGVLALIAVVLASGMGKDQRVEYDGRAEALVSDARTRTATGGGPNGATTTRVVRVRYDVGGTRYTASLRGGGHTRLRAGDAVDVVYRADEPGRPYVKRWAESKPPGGAGTVVGIVVLAALCVVCVVGGFWFLFFG
ncbi:DUF3592 domain-containing protein [Streptomyces sp. O3]